ncbi:5'-methylthioadenosine/S-adenosylhomocysteine nucleosidase [Actinotalea sp. M2MS4P-6]|uniref:5'-methylthioadenosine/S-adenosylhomocysteine nucleosidase n=1 Tax=Actinotalea sp. M2MS4P-6 TaxID=2983762 RepID=UPI0021E38080|nr:5'-methylthioadenosine/S-adenosylhomocysteine nucleosidase [Actinotalea sp. M2MS4P-6]MCV2393540.1 5'-methylthioadenosine/S-adenosylhomocysteine nucleosidase [Actinotalea sp. M2MS4P-6]
MTDALVIVAMGAEAEPFRQRASSAGPVREVGHAEHSDLVLAGREVRLVASGIGLVRAAVALTLALQEVGPVVVISAGSAGGVGMNVHVGDVVVGDAYTFHSADATAFGYERGQVPGMPVVFPASAAHVEAARALTLPDGTVRTGLMLSGDSFVDARTVDEVRGAFPGALSTDMETTALAQASYLAGVPFVSVRGVSDLCGPIAGDDFRTHVDDAADRSARIVEALLDAV